MRRFSVFLVLLLTGCPREKTPGPSQESGPPTARTEVEGGPVKFAIEVTPAKPSLSDELTLTLTIDAAEGVKIDKPPFGKSMGSFLIRDFREPLPELKQGRQVLRQIYKLEPTLPGEQVIHPIPLTFTDNRKEGDGQTHTIESEALVIHISSLVGNEVPSLANLKPPAGPIGLPSRRAWGKWLIAFVILVVGIGVVGVVLWRRRKKGVEPQLSPAELAYQELQRLLQDDPVGRGDIKTFYVEVTAIVRRYIERTVGIRAPEQTTEEFLHAMKDHSAFSGEKKAGLKSFLESEDMVKFAAFEPSRQDIEASFERAKEFVGLTSVPAGVTS